MTKEDIDLVRLALSAYHTRTVYPGCVEAFDRIVIEMGSVDKTAKEIVVDALRRDQARRKNEYIKHFERQEAFERIVQEKEMPTPMTIEMEADERQAALDIVNEQAEDDGLWFVAKYASEAYLQQELRRLHRSIELAALQSPRVPVIEGLDEAITVFEKGIPDLSDYEIVGVYLADCERYEDRCRMVAEAARAYAELQKGN